jgi:hypothetical protein
VVHRNGHSGSPLVSGSTTLSNAATSPGCAASTRFRPAPDARIRVDGATPSSTLRAPPCTGLPRVFRTGRLTYIMQLSVDV